MGRGGEKGCTLIFLTVEGEGGGWRLMFFFSFIGNVEGGGGKGVNLGALEMFFSLWRG